MQLNTCMMTHFCEGQSFVLNGCYSLHEMDEKQNELHC